MRFFKLHIPILAVLLAFAFCCAVLPVQQSAFAQETTGGLQGTVKDASGAVVPRAKVVLSGTTLLGTKELITDASGYYHFANLPPGAYSLTITAQGFKTYKQAGLAIEVGHLPTVDIVLQVGAEATTVEVTAAAPVIDTTTTQSLTNVTAQALQNLPTGISYQSVIQFAPMAREEPLSGYSMNGRGTGGTGGSMPGSSGNGLGFGFMIGGAADSESSYLVDGQDTENISGGYSKANVPMEFIQDIDIKTSSIEAEYGGALGGVINAVTKSGGNDFHGEVFSYYDSSGTDANDVNAYLRYDPNGPQGTNIEPNPQVYSPQKDHFRTIQPGVIVGGPIYRDRLWFTAAFEPLFNSRGRTVNFTAADASLGNQYFTRDRQQYFGLGRLDAALTQKIRVYFKWLPEYARETGAQMPTADPTASESSYLNPDIFQPISQFFHGIGWSAPVATFNAGADITLTQKLVATTRYGYFFDNYHDFGWPTTTPDLYWQTASATDVQGNALPSNLSSQPAGASTTPYDEQYTLFNSDKHYQFDQDFAFFKGGWWGTHNFKFGYQLNHLVNIIDQNGNVPYAFLQLGPKQSHGALTTTGAANCAKLKAEWGGCTGQYGYLVVQDFSTILKGANGAPTPASDWNHALYVQDSWNVGKGLTFDVGLRIEKESLPAPGGVKVSAINFPWSDKIEPRLGAAWDPTRRGKMKLYGSYGVVNDVMKLLLAQTSFGAQAYEQCTYPLGPDGTAAGFSVSDIDLMFTNGRACPNGPATTQANFANGQVPPSLTDAATKVSLIENVNERPWEPVAPGVKPYRQHSYTIGWDYEFTPTMAFHVRYDRRRLDHAIEDASLSDINWGETYAVVNPGEGVNSTINGYANFLASLGQAFGVPGWQFDATDFGTCNGCPPNPKPIRNYDGVEFRLTMNNTHHVSGEVSYSYSSLWGNYPGLTTTDQTDGGITGRNSPDTTRSFDEPFYYFGANGKSNAGPMPTDRPNVVKGNVYYTLPWLRRQSTSFGIFQQFLQGSPMSSYIDMVSALPPEPYEATYVFGRGNWVNMTSNPTTGAVTVGTPYARRTPWFSQSDLNASHSIRVGDQKTIAFEATALNALNQRTVTSYWGALDSMWTGIGLAPGAASLYSGAPLYQELESGYNVQQYLTSNGGGNPNVIGNSQYGKPYLFQQGRQVRFALRYTF